MTDSTQQYDEPSVKARLKELLDEIAFYIDYATEQDQRRLLSSLEEFARSDRRRHPRKPCSIEVTLATWRVFKEFVRNISAGGMFIQTSEAFSVGQHIKLMFSSPVRGEPIELNGQVVWIAPEGIGVKFTTPSKDLEEIVASL